jgi:hypothetical protein
MNNWRVMTVQVKQTPKNLARPIFYCFDVHMLVPFAIPAVPENQRYNIAMQHQEQKLCNTFRRRIEAYCLSVPDVNISVIKLTVFDFLSTHE